MSNEQFLYNRPTFPAQLNMAHPLTKGLVGCWVLNEEGGMRAFDSSPYKNHGLVTGAKGNYQGRTFNGTSDYIKNSTADWQSSDSSGTILVWFKTSSATTQALFGSCDEATANYQFGFLIDSTGVLSLAQINNDAPASVILGNTQVIDNNWHLGTFVSNGSIWSMYSDLTLQSITVSSGSNNGDWLADTTLRDNFSIGVRIRSTIINYMVGTIGEVLVYNRALILPEIRSLFLQPWDMFLR